VTPPPHVVLIDFEAVTDIEITAPDELTKMTADLRARRIVPWVAAAVADQREMGRRFGTNEDLRSFPTAQAAVAAYEAGT
jgi:hypothetical protein